MTQMNDPSQNPYQPPSQAPPPAVPAPAEGPDKSARTWGMLCHLAGLGLFIFPPVGNIIGPLIVWLIKKDEHPFIDRQGKEALNFQITMTIIYLVLSISFLCGIGFILVPLAVLAGLIFLILATIKANEGQDYHYPFAIRFVK